MTAFGVHAHPTFKLGRRAPSGRPALRLAHILTGAVPAHPVAADHFTQISDWGLYANDRYGDCGPTSVANARKLVSRYLGGVEQSPTQEDVFDLYRRSGNPNFDPNTDADDNGVIMQTMLDAVNKDGIGGTRCVAFAKVDHDNLDELRAAISIFGFLLLGVNLEVAQQAQTSGQPPVWDYQRSPLWGGHAVLTGVYTSQPANDLSVITWGKVVGASDAFVNHQLEEAWAVIWPENLGTTQFQEGVDLAALSAAYTDLTGRPLPTEAAPPSVPV